MRPLASQRRNGIFFQPPKRQHATQRKGPTGKALDLEASERSGTKALDLASEAKLVPRKVIVWHRVFDFQIQSLKLLSVGILQGSSQVGSGPPAGG